MADFTVPADLMFSRALVDDAATFAAHAGAASWLYLCGPDFADVPGGMSYADVQRAVPESANVVSDTVPLTMDLARAQVAALDALPRPTLVTCRVGPRSAALVYLYAGLQAGASAADVIARAEADDAPFVHMEPLKAWLTQGLAELG